MVEQIPPSSNDNGATDLELEASSEPAALTSATHENESAFLALRRRINPFSKNKHPDPRYLSSTQPLSDALTRPTPDFAKQNWRQFLAHNFETTRFHMAIIGLTFLDMVFIVTELLVQVVASTTSCRLVDAEGHYKAELVFSPSVNTALEVLFWLSISILVLFCTEISMKFMVFGPLYFFRHPFELFDAVVIVTSLVLDLVFHGQEEGVAIEVLIVLRMWRLVRIMDSVAGEVKDNLELQKHKFEKKLKEMEKKIEERDREIAELKAKVGVANGLAGGVLNEENGKRTLNPES